MMMRVVLTLAVLSTPALSSAQELRLIPREVAQLPSVPGAAASNFVSRSDLAESSPFAAITATDPRLRAGAAACQPGATNDISSPTLEPCSGSQPGFYSRFVDSPEPIPLTGLQKAHLALRNVIDPGGLATLGSSSAFTILTNSHTAYGPGVRGLGRAFGVGLVQDATGQFFGTWAIPALTRQDPRYHRMPHAPVTRRFVHAVSHTILAQHDDGRPMLNLSALGTYPITAEISNLYIPGIHGNGPSTAARILTGYATDPVDNLISEFLPDVARHIQIHLIFTQHLLNQLSSDQSPAVP
jgi:hypothetical protein